MDVGEQLVSEGDRLGVLEMGHPGSRGVHLGRRLIDESELQVDETRRHLAGMVTQVHPQVGGNLVIAATPRPQLAAERAEAFEQTPFQGRVHVLVVDGRAEPPGSHSLGQIIQGREYRGDLVVVEQAGAVQDAGVRA